MIEWVFDWRGERVLLIGGRMSFWLEEAKELTTYCNGIGGVIHSDASKDRVDGKSWQKMSDYNFLSQQPAILYEARRGHDVLALEKVRPVKLVLGCCIHLLLEYSCDNLLYNTYSRVWFSKLLTFICGTVGYHGGVDDLLNWCLLWYLWTAVGYSKDSGIFW